MHIEVSGHGRLDAVQELTEFLGAMAGVTGADDGSGSHRARQSAPTARNLGAQLARGRVLLFLDSDMIVQGD